MPSVSLARSNGVATGCDRLRVALVIDGADPFSRGCMAGVSQWCRKHPGWSVVVEETSAARTAVARRRWPPMDGVISWNPPTAVPKSWRAEACPVVFVSENSGEATTPLVASDDLAAARLATDHLVEQGMRQLGYVAAGFRGESGRLAAIRDRAGHHAAAIDVLDARAAADRLPKWVAALPKPLGIVAGSDRIGLKVLEACRDGGLSVPDDVAVVGIGNDECLCDFAVPGLSSVAHNVAGIGYEACRVLADRLHGRPAPRQRLVPPAGVVVRGSSDLLTIDDPVVRRAVKAIRQLAADGLTPESLAEKIGLPRRTLDRQFRKHFGRTVHDELVRARLAKARKLLAETDHKLLAVAVRSGFRDASHLCHAFKEAFGGSPMDYRRQVRPWEAASGAENQ